MILMLLNALRFVSWPKLESILVNVSWLLENNMYSVVFEWSIL